LDDFMRHGLVALVERHGHAEEPPVIAIIEQLEARFVTLGDGRRNLAGLSVSAAPGAVAGNDMAGVAAII
jgi:hypothetical protein